jgi:hypothetical protein
VEAVKAKECLERTIRVKEALQVSLLARAKEQEAMKAEHTVLLLENNVGWEKVADRKDVELAALLQEKDKAHSMALAHKEAELEELKALLQVQEKEHAEKERLRAVVLETEISRVVLLELKEAELVALLQVKDAALARKERVHSVAFELKEAELVALLQTKDEEHMARERARERKRVRVLRQCADQHSRMTQGLQAKHRLTIENLRRACADAKEREGKWLEAHTEEAERRERENAQVVRRKAIVGATRAVQHIIDVIDNTIDAANESEGTAVGADGVEMIFPMAATSRHTAGSMNDEESGGNKRVTCRPMAFVVCKSGKDGRSQTPVAPPHARKPSLQAALASEECNRRMKNRTVSP